MTPISYLAGFTVYTMLFEVAINEGGNMTVTTSSLRHNFRSKVYLKLNVMVLTGALNIL